MASRTTQRANNYKQTFCTDKGDLKGPASQVLGDLKRFCFGDRSPLMTSQISGMADPIATGVAIGRQEVWFRIMNALNYSEMEIAHLRETLAPEQDEE